MVESSPKSLSNNQEFFYERHRPEESVLYKLIQQNLETFLELFQTEMGHPLPDFVIKEFYEYLNCGILANGFLRVQCESCHKENLVAFSCKRRGFCPSCGAGSCNVNIHFHQMYIDGAYELNADRAPTKFHRIARPTVPELEVLVQTIAHRVAKYLEKNGIIAKDEETSLQLNIPTEEGFSQLQAASSSYRFLLGPNKGKKALTLKTEADRDHRKGSHVGKYSGFTLHAGVAVDCGHRKKLEKICRYIARPAISEERLSVNARGQVIYKLKTPYDNGTTQIVFEPMEFMENLDYHLL